jgi:hypothetical protein
VLSTPTLWVRRIWWKPCARQPSKRSNKTEGVEVPAHIAALAAKLAAACLEYEQSKKIAAQAVAEAFAAAK